MTDISTTVNRARTRLLEMHYKANAGHIGGNMSCIDAMIVLHHQIMKPHDRFILSKGHSAGALYVTLWSLGKLSDKDLDTFCTDDTRLPGHPSGTGVPDLLFPTGSLGHGPSLSAGLALAAKHKRNGVHVYCLCSDGEWQEGSCWEALSFAVHNRLSNLTIMVDQNGLQGFGRTEDIISCNDLSARFKSFGASLCVVDGHNLVDVRNGLKHISSDMPNVLILNTVKGRGLHYENSLESHYLPLSEDQYRFALDRINKGNEP